jgi:hypothetical protein
LRVHGGLALLRNRGGCAGVGGSGRGTRHRWRWAKDAEEMGSRMGTNNGEPTLEPTTTWVDGRYSRDERSRAFARYERGSRRDFRDENRPREAALLTSLTRALPRVMGA